VVVVVVVMVEECKGWRIKSIELLDLCRLLYKKKEGRKEEEGKGI